MIKKVKGFKCFNKDFTCNNFQFKVGKTFKHEGKIELCKEGFHFCKDLQNVFKYYGFDSTNHVCEIEASIEVIDGDDKSVCRQIKIIRELSWDEVLKGSNLGINNLGFGNAGSRNAGNDNAGSSNAGSGNAGSSNAGNDNAGNDNAGSSNAGYGNAGNDNAGYGNAGYGNAGSSNAGNDNAGSSNAGNRNAGYGNAGNDNAGMFNSNPGKLRLFNKEANVKWEDDRIQNAIRYSPNFQEYVFFSNMTDAEKVSYPYAKTTGGYYRQLGYKEGWIRFWGNSTENVKSAFLKLPNFDKKVFEEITGIKI